MNGPRDNDEDRFLRRLRDSAALQDAPEHVVQRALHLWSPRPQSAPGALRRLLAALTFDSGLASPLSYGMRSTGSPVRQLLFTVEGIDVDLRVAAAPAGQGFLLTGQVLGPESPGALVLQPEDGGSRQVAQLNELGEFEFTAVPAGAYRLTLELADVAIELPLLSVPDAA